MDILELNRRIADAVDDLDAMIEWLREEKQFEKADRLRTITGRIARLRVIEPNNSPSKDLVCEQARGYR